MRRDDTHTRISFLCSGCLRSTDTVVPTTNDIMIDYGKAEDHIIAEGWTIRMKGYDTQYYCRRCSHKDDPKPQGRFVQNTLCD